MSEAYLKSLRRDYADLLAKYGQGTRPGWVSADLGMLKYQIEKEEEKKDGRE